MIIYPIQISDKHSGVFAPEFKVMASDFGVIDWSRDIGMQDIICLCSNLHSSNIGTSDPLTDEDEEVTRRILNDRLRHWVKSHCAYDGHVRALIVSVLWEPDHQGRRWSYMYQGSDTPKPW